MDIGWKDTRFTEGMFDCGTKIYMMAALAGSLNAGSAERPDFIQRKTGRLECRRHFLPHLETVNPDSRSYHNLNILGNSTEILCHLEKGDRSDFLAGSPPSAVHGTNCPVHRIIYQNREAVRTSYANGNVPDICNESIIAVKFIPFYPRLVNQVNFGLMDLMHLDHRIRQRRVPPCGEGLNPGCYVEIE